MSLPTERLYYTDSYRTIFESDVLQHLTYRDQPAVILAESAFYPTGGGQPHDTGTLNGVRVIGVEVDDVGQVIHLLDKSLEATRVQGQVDWPRRFDHMIHHSGQHILTRAFIETRDAETVGFHLGEDSATIDLDTDQLSEADIDAAEDLANQIIAENRPVRAWFPSPDELAALNLRKVSEKVTGPVRVVDIGDFDVTACGGTHVAHTAEVGLLKVIRADKRGDTTRLEFCCGARALADYRHKNRVLLDLSAQLTTGITDLPDVIHKTREENKALGKALDKARAALWGYEAEALWATAEADSADGPVIVKQVVDEANPQDLNRLAAQLIDKPRTVALLGTAGDKAHLVLARSDDLESLDVVPLLKTALAVLDTQRGGGRPALAQGGGVAASPSQVQAALDAAEAALHEAQ